ncbi:hypothetical protein SAMN04487766_10258 [Actinomyces ruminicola]|uniref:Uncharacterized protein n=2 Tax=Actinomyces ruminicola TaxID=332524 RepID=A0A1G9SQS4_9ACTO|nr:hypothetical protein SAMN04487766_10258 [Actinomyces ruminicola]
MKRRRFLTGLLATAALPLLSACRLGTPSNAPTAAAGTATAASSATPAPSMPIAFADAGPLPGSDFRPESFTWLRDRYLVGSGSRTWWYGDPTAGQYWYFTAEASEPDAMKLVAMNSAETYRTLAEQPGPARILSDEIMVVDAAAHYGYVVVTAVRTGVAQDSAWQAHVVKVDLSAATVVGALPLDVDAAVGTALGNWAAALNQDGTRLGVATGRLGGACRAWAIDTESLAVVRKDPHQLGYDCFQQISGDALLTGTESSSYTEGAYPPYIVYSLESGNLLTQENNRDTYLLGNWLYWLETAYDAWRVMDVSTGEEVALTDPPPVGTLGARPTVWETGGYSVILTDSALDVRALGSPTAGLSLSADAGDAIPVSLAVHRDIVYAAYASKPHELHLIDLATGEETAVAALGGQEDGIDREPQALLVSEVGAGYFYSRGGSCTFHQATDWRDK